MKVFISWSGPRSRALATALRRWLPDVIQNVRPWMSETDISAGARWGREIEKELEDTKFGILCLTRENVLSPWINFEAGALAKTVADSHVCPYLLGLNPADLPQGPLAQFQAKRAEKADTWDLVVAINHAMGDGALADDQLRRTFDRWWPDLQQDIEAIPEAPVAHEPARTLHSMVEEVLELVRGLARRASLETQLVESLLTSHRRDVWNRRATLPYTLRELINESWMSSPVKRTVSDFFGSIEGAKSDNNDGEDIDSRQDSSNKKNE